MAFDYSHASWDGLRNHLRDLLWEDIFKLHASVTGTEFCEIRLELMYISLPVNIRSSFIHFHGFQLLVLLPYHFFLVPTE